MKNELIKLCCAMLAAAIGLTICWQISFAIPARLRLEEWLGPGIVFCFVFGILAGFYAAKLAYAWILGRLSPTKGAPAAGADVLIEASAVMVATACGAVVFCATWIMPMTTDHEGAQFVWGMVGWLPACVLAYFVGKFAYAGVFTIVRRKSRS